MGPGPSITAFPRVEFSINRDFGWTFVNKEDTEAYWTKILGTWSAQGVMITILFVLILILQKRKDVV